LAVIQIKANHNSVWDYIKPTLKTGEVRPELRKPTSPAVKDFSTAPNATIQSLNSEQLRRYEMAYTIYKDDLKDWQRRQTTIVNGKPLPFQICFCSSVCLLVCQLACSSVSLPVCLLACLLVC
jgi:hypothetical protein